MWWRFDQRTRYPVECLARPQGGHAIGPARGAQTVVLEVPPLAAAPTGTLAGPGAGPRPPPVMAPPVPLPPVGIVQPGVPQPPILPAAGPVQRDGSAVTQ